MRPLEKFFAWLGGRSGTELRQHRAEECDLSISVGSLAMVSAGAIAFGQYLFWSHLPHTAAAAPVVAGFLVLLYTSVYRGLIRAAEVMHWSGRLVVYGLAAGIMAVNAVLAGHEIVILANRPQVEAQAALDAANGVGGYATAVENSLGLPRLRGDSRTLYDALSASRTERVRVPDAVLGLQLQAQECDAVAVRLRKQIPNDVEAPTYARAMSVWREQRARCNAMRLQAERDLQDHKNQLDTQIVGLSIRSRASDQKLSEATARLEASVAREAPVINASATSGFARHAALWAAVEAGRVPWWEAYGLMALALILEGLTFIVKLLLPPDAVTLERRERVELDHALGDMRMQTARAYRAGVPAVVMELAAEFAMDAKDDVRNIVAPGLRNQLAARAFDQAHRNTEEAQRRTAKPAPSLLQRLQELYYAVRQRMRPVASSV